jgi:hypothetical protein
MSHNSSSLNLQGSRVSLNTFGVSLYGFQCEHLWPQGVPETEWPQVNMQGFRVSVKGSWVSIQGSRVSLHGSKVSLHGSKVSLNVFR